MPTKKKLNQGSRSVIIKRLSLALAFAVVAYASYIYGSMENDKFNASVTKSKALMSNHETKLELLYDIAKAQSAGVKLESDKEMDTYANNLSDDKLAKYKTPGPITRFCADRSPDTIKLSPLNNYGAVVHAGFFNGPGKEVTTKSILVDFEKSGDEWGVNDKISKITCP